MGIKPYQEKNTTAMEKDLAQSGISVNVTFPNVIWYHFPRDRFYLSSIIVFDNVHAATYGLLGFRLYCLFEVFKQSNFGLRKYLYIVHFAVSELSLALKKNAVCLGSRDHHQASCSRVPTCECF